MVTVPLPAGNTPGPALHLRQVQPTVKMYRAELERCFMNHLRTPLGAIGGRERSANPPRFLIAENSWEDKLTILQWNEHMASRAGIKVACSIEHVEELVIHSTTTGSLTIPSHEPNMARLAGGRLRRVAELTSAGHGVPKFST
jgi:hypothetical protein